MSLALRISSDASSNRQGFVASFDTLIREATALSALLASIKDSSREYRFLELVRSEGISVYSINALRDPEVLKACLENDDLWQRLNRAKERLDRNEWVESFAVKPKSPVDSTSWIPAGLRNRFLVTTGRGWPVAKPVEVWRASRKRFHDEGSSGSLQKKDPVDAGRVWKCALENLGFLRGIPGATVNRTVHQCLQWLGVKMVPEHRTPRDFPFFQAGFSDLAKDAPLECGDVAAYHEPIFSSIAIVIKVRPPATPVEVAFLLGGELCLAHPLSVGEMVTCYRKTHPARAEYLVESLSRCEESAFHRPRYLDALVEVEDRLRQTPLPEGPLEGARLTSWPGIVEDDWMVTVRLKNGDEIYLHLTVHPGAKKRRLAVVTDYYPWGLKGLHDESTKAAAYALFKKRLEVVDRDLVSWLTLAATRLQYNVLDVFYKMVGPAGFHDQTKEILSRRGYVPKDSPGWSHLPGKRVRIGS